MTSNSCLFLNGILCDFDFLEQVGTSDLERERIGVSMSMGAPGVSGLAW